MENFSHLPHNSRRQHLLDDADARQRRLEHDARVSPADISHLPAEPCPAGYVAACCRGCQYVIYAPAKTERPLCPRCQRQEAERDRRSEENDAAEAEDAERWDGMG